MMFTSILLCSLVVAYSEACGGFFCAPQQPVVQAGEAIIFGVKERNVSMHVQINYEGPAEDFSWLLPVMFEPTLTVSSDPFFRSMFAQTLPQFRFRVDQENSTTCDPNLSFDGDCEFGSGSDGPAPVSPNVGGGVAVKEGSVGPFDFKIIKAVDKDVNAIRNWLADNGYDEYEGSLPIIAHYVESDHYFVALRLKKEAGIDSGDLVPIALEYEMPEGMETIACVPLILTSVAVTETLPIQVYILGDLRADPVNFFRVELDETKVDWLACQSNPQCFDRDYRARSEFAFKAVNDHAFVEEYAGSSDVMKNQIRFDINATALALSTTVLEFLNLLTAAGVPAFGLLDGILNDFIPQEFSDQEPFLRDACASAPSIYTPGNAFQMSNCVDSLLSKEYDFAGLAAEIKTRVIDPAEDAQMFTDSFKYLTRLWVNMRQENMVKDPFFRFRETNDLADRSNVHLAVGVPVCNTSQNQQVTELEIRVPGGATTRVPTLFDSCFGMFMKTNFDPLYGENNSSGLQLVVPGFGGETDRFLLRQDDGSFDEQAIIDAFALLDGRVMNQTVAPFNTPAPTPSPPQTTPSPVVTTPETSSPTGAPVVAPPTITSASRSSVFSYFTSFMVAVLQCSLLVTFVLTE